MQIMLKILQFTNIYANPLFLYTNIACIYVNYPILYVNYPILYVKIPLLYANIAGINGNSPINIYEAEQGK